LNPFTAAAERKKKSLDEQHQAKDDDKVTWNPDISEYVAPLVESGAAQGAKIGRAGHQA
jgi:hypothetical protein